MQPAEQQYLRQVPYLLLSIVVGGHMRMFILSLPSSYLYFDLRFWAVPVKVIGIVLNQAGA